MKNIPIILPAELQLVLVGYFRAANLRVINPYYIKPGEECIEIITKGRIIWEYDGCEYGPGSIFWHIRGGHTIHITPPDDPYECFAFRFHTGCLRRPVPLITHWDDPDTLNEFGNEAMRCYHDESSDRTILGHYLYYRLRWIVNQCTRSGIVHQYPSVVRRAIEYVQANLEKDISIEQIARKVHISEPYLYTLFRQHIKASPHQYILEQRLKRARQLLAGGDLPIKEIGVKCGFAGVENFYRAFNRRHDMAPGEYRRKHKPYEAE